MDNRLIPADTRLREEPADQMEVYLGRSLDALDAILENCMASMERLATGEQKVDCHQTVEGSLEYFSAMTDAEKDGASKSLDDMSVMEDLSGFDNSIPNSIEHLMDDRPHETEVDQALRHDS